MNRRKMFKTIAGSLAALPFLPASLRASTTTPERFFVEFYATVANFKGRMSDALANLHTTITNRTGARPFLVRMNAIALSHVVIGLEHEKITLNTIALDSGEHGVMFYNMPMVLDNLHGHGLYAVTVEVR